MNAEVEVEVTEEFALIRNGRIVVGPCPSGQWNETTTLQQAADRWYPGAVMAHRTVTQTVETTTWETTTEEGPTDD